MAYNNSQGYALV